MKSRSHRLQMTDAHDDWVDGSWTVDCICGVNFDDGEEMVNCDECGVWVHTRCSRYVKSEQSFACDKCKSRSSRNNDSEETEVAQLLVDLPNKTLRMDRPYPSNGPSRRSFKLFTHKPFEERAHVQGVPGGDPNLFAGVSSVFSPQLWKCTGYVPKKLNFQYREFPSWNEEAEQAEKQIGEGNDSTTENENTAGVLFSLLKESMSSIHLASPVDVKGLADDVKVDKGASSEQMKKLNGEDVDISFAQNAVKKDASLFQTTSVISVKRKKEDVGSSKDGSEKKRARVIEKEGDSKNKAKLTSAAASTTSSDGKQFEFYEDRGPKATKANTESSKTGDSENPTPADHLSNGPQNGEKNANNDKKHAAADEHDLEIKMFDTSRCNANSDGSPKEDGDGDKVPTKIETSPKVNEVVGDTLDSSNDNQGDLAQRKKFELPKLEPAAEDMAVARTEVKECLISQDLSCEFIASSSETNTGVKAEADENSAVLNVQHLSLHEERLDSVKLSAQQFEVSTISSSDKLKMNDAAIFSSDTSDQIQDADRSTVDGVYEQDKVDLLTGCHQRKPDSTGSEGSQGVRDSSSGFKPGSTGLECSLGARKSSSGHKPSSKYHEGIVTLGARTSSSDFHQRKLEVGKSSSEICKSSTAGSRLSVNLQTQSTSSKQKGSSDGNLGSKKDIGSSNVPKDEQRTERSKKIAKSSLSSGSRVSQSPKFSHAQVHKRCSSDSKDFAFHSSSKLSVAPSVSATPGSGESASSLKSVGTSNVQNRTMGSGLSQKSEKTNQPDVQPSLKVNASQMQPPASSNHPTGLSDEELALLLHQELNSSPRVPRVPRMRHAGSLPQLTSPTAASMLMKRTSSSGGKDFSSANRRKPKESSKDGSRSARDEAKRVDRVSPSPDLRRQDSVCTTDPLTKREVEGGLQKDLAKKNSPTAPTATASSGLSSSTEVYEYKVSSAHNSPRHASDGVSGAVGHPAPLTLPGLIAKIMSKGERMTYEELCNAVLPHWPYLRKHNGERYAYSSHSQAVLDCLRNRNEWARLVDRGPKTSTSRKRRKHDADPSGAESEDNGGRRERSRNDGRSKSIESQQEECPKGKRQARKRRRLALQGRGIKDLRRRRRETEVISDEEVGSTSNSSGDGSSPSGTEASASSDGTET